MEEAGVPTAGISLVRPHTETIRPPRALWVPFEMGRPLGTPDDAAFQRRVLLALLGLLEAPEGPVLEDFPEDAPEAAEEATVLACPVNFALEADESEEADPLLASLRREMTAMRPWYDMAVNKRQRTTVGVSGIGLDELAEFICAFVRGEEPPNPRDDVGLPYTLKMAVEDLKAYYIEGITAQPGQAGASSRKLNDWFWDDTVAGKVLLKLARVCAASSDEMMHAMGDHFLVPHDVIQRHAE
jgi:hypothetical protein